MEWRIRECRMRQCTEHYEDEQRYRSYLTTHEYGCKLNNVRFDLHISYCLCCLQTKKSTTDNSRTLNVVLLDVSKHILKIFNRLSQMMDKSL